MARFFLVLAGALLPSLAFGQSLGSAFTYQGQLADNGEPANGLYDLRACLFDSAESGAELVCAPDIEDLAVQDGLFSVSLDFGPDVFVGEQRWIEIRVRPGSSVDPFAILQPRQAIQPSPESLHAERASTADFASTAPWAGLTGVPLDFADGVDNDSGGTITSIATGSGLTGGPITDSGTIGIAVGGVGAAQIADSAVGAAAIDPSQVQVRVSGICAPGNYLRGINSDGSVVCSPLLNQIQFRNLIIPGVEQGRFPSIAIGADGNPVISHWNNASGQLQVRHCTNPVCSGNIPNLVVDSGSVGIYSSLAISGDGFPVISYYDYANSNLKVAKCNDVACAEPAVISTVDADAVNAVGVWTSLAIGSDGLPVIAYQDATNGALKVAKCNDAACSSSAQISVVDSGNGNSVAFTTSIAIGDDGLPVIAYHDESAQALKVAHCVDLACSQSATISVLDSDGSAASEFGAYSSIDIGNDGVPVISYWDTVLRVLKVAKCSDMTCAANVTLSIVDDPADGSSVGAWTSLKVGADGLPRISYWDQTYRDPKFALCADPACAGPGHEIISLPDGNVDEGNETSLALRADGAPIIAHQQRQGILRLVVCGTLNCQ